MERILWIYIILGLGNRLMTNQFYISKKHKYKKINNNYLFLEYLLYYKLNNINNKNNYSLYI